MGNPKHRVNKICLWCGERFEVAFYRRYLAKYCSKPCHGSATYKKIGKKRFLSEVRQTFKGVAHYNWKGGVKKHPEGYLWEKAEGHPFADSRGYVMQHRLVMERLIGRFLTKNEVVHHKNRVKSDNRIENLELHNNQSEHLKHHHKDQPPHTFGLH